MYLNFIKKSIVSTVIFFITLTINEIINLPVQIVRAYDEQRFISLHPSVTEFTTYDGQNAAIIPIPENIFIFIKDVSLQDKPDYLNETFINNNIIIYGLKPEETYNDIFLIIEVSNDTQFIYKIPSFTFNTENTNGIYQPNNDLTNIEQTNSNKQTLLNHFKNFFKSIGKFFKQLFTGKN